VRERLYLSAGFHNGWIGLRRMLENTPPSNQAEVQQLSDAIKAMVTKRAYEMMLLSLNGVPSAEDFGRYAEVMKFPPQANASEQANKAAVFADLLTGALRRKAAEQPENPALAAYRSEPTPAVPALPSTGRN
jgi:hypothetical protein